MKNVLPSSFRFDRSIDKIISEKGKRALCCLRMSPYRSVFFLVFFSVSFVFCFVETLVDLRKKRCWDTKFPQAVGEDGQIHKPTHAFAIL